MNSLKRLYKPEYGAPALGALVLILSCILVSQNKYLWLDEILTYFPVSFSSFPKFFAYLTDQINGGHYLYFMLLWIWTHIFSASELSLRLFSSLGFVIAEIVIWYSLFRQYGFWVASLSTLGVFLTAPHIFEQNAEARFYGLLLAISALLVYVTFSRIQQTKATRKNLLLLFALHGALLLTHPFGIVYSLTFIGGTFLWDAFHKSLRPWYYLSSFAGWLLFIPFIPAFLRQLEFMQPHFWIEKPLAIELFSILFGRVSLSLIIMALVYILIGLHFSSKNTHGASKAYNDRHIIWFATILILLPCSLWIYSQFMKPVFLARYLIIVEIGKTLFVAILLSRFLPLHKQLSIFQKRFFTFVLIVLCIFPLIQAIQIKPEPLPGSLDLGQNESISLRNLPIVVDTPHGYLPRFMYSPYRKNYFYLLDWEAASVAKNDLHATSDFKYMRAVKNYVPELNIVQSEAFLQTHERFIVVNTISKDWFEYRIQNNPHYMIEKLATSTYLVSRKFKNL